MEGITADCVRKGDTLDKWLVRRPEENKWLLESNLLHCQDAAKRFSVFRQICFLSSSPRDKEARSQQQAKAAKAAEAHLAAVSMMCSHEFGLEFIQ